jgi:Tfp pilus assembly protein PilN
VKSNAPNAQVVIEWAPGAVMAFDAHSGQYIKGSTLLDVAPRLSSRDAVVGVSRRACFIREVTVPDAPKDELLQALTMTIAQHVPMESGEACVDIRLQGEAGPEGRSGTLIAMRAGDLRRLREEARQAGIRILATLPAAYGSWVQANATALRDCAAVSETSEGMAVDLISGGELRYSRALGKESMNGHLAPEVARTFMAAGMSTAPTLAQGIRLGAAEYTVEKAPLEALVGSAWSHAGVEFELPEVLAARRKAARARRSQITAVLWTAALVLVAIAYLDWAGAQHRYQAVQERSSTNIALLAEKRDALLNDVKAAQARERLLSQGFRPAQRLGDVAALVSNALPKGAWLTNISVERGQVVSVRGTALSGEHVTAYVESLAKQSRLRDVRLQFANNGLIESTPVVNFAVSAFPIGNLPLVEKTKGGKK